MQSYYLLLSFNH